VKTNYAKIKTKLKNRTRRRKLALSSIACLGCDGPTLEKHFKTQFKHRMTWHNYGEGNGRWNIDHIVPLSAFNLNDPQHCALAFHYKNLRPMWYHDNVVKGSHYEHELGRKYV